MSGFIWYELMSPDPKASEAFYTKVIGWTPRAFQGTEGYTVMNVGEAGVGGIMAAPEGAPAMWVGYIAVDDIDVALTSLTAAGGRIYKPAWDIPDVGRLAAVADPQGAMFMLMQPSGPDTSTRPAPYTPGDIGWRELHTTDWEGGFAFYSGQFGWEKDTAMDMGEMGTYQLFAYDGAQRGGMMNSPQAPTPAWLFYFNVEGVEAAKGRIESAGGTVQMGPHEVPGGGWIIMAADPQGVNFAVTGPK
ncbi:MAG: VOC family protein [Caulobacteraceae bacterium]